MYHFILDLSEIEKNTLSQYILLYTYSGYTCGGYFFIWDTFKYVTSTGLVQLAVTHVWGKTIRGLEIPRH